MVRLLLISCMVWWCSLSQTVIPCPPNCVGSDRSSVYVGLSQDVVIRGLVVAGKQTSGKRITGSSGEIDYAIHVLDVFKGGVWLKRVGKNVVHVTMGISTWQGSQCPPTDLLQLNQTYLLSGWAAPPSTASRTARIRINVCALTVNWNNVDQNSQLWLQESLRTRQGLPCMSTLTSGGTRPSCSCAATETCMTNEMGQGTNVWCGTPAFWCVSNQYFV